jgi:hypothetical protein
MRLKNPQEKQRRHMPAHQKIARPNHTQEALLLALGSLIALAALALSVFAVGLASFSHLAATPKHSRYRRPYAC